MNEPTFDDLPDPAKTNLDDFLKAAAKRARAIWKKHNPDSPARPGPRSNGPMIIQACERIGEQRNFDFRNTTVQAVAKRIANALPATEKVSEKTILTYLRQWMLERVDHNRLPNGLAYYLLKSRKEYQRELWTFCWGMLFREDPEAKKWMRSKFTTIPFPDLPHQILPEELTKRYSNWESQYTQWINGEIARTAKNHESRMNHPGEAGVPPAEIPPRNSLS